MGKRVRVARREAMAARCGVPEEAVNRCVLQFYFHQAMAAYRSGRNRDFRQLRDVMQGGPRGPGLGESRRRTGRKGSGDSPWGKGGGGGWEGAGPGWG